MVPVVECTANIKVQLVDSFVNVMFCLVFFILQDYVEKWATTFGNLIVIPHSPFLIFTLSFVGFHN